MTPTRSTARWAVVGGGFLGMTLALRLAQQGKNVTLIEAAPYLGGVASAWQLGDIIWDRHYHVILGSDTYVRSLLRELRLESDLRWASAQTMFYVDRKFHSMSNAVEFLRFPPLNLIEKLRLAVTILHAARIKDSKPLEQILVSDWLRKWSGARVAEKIWLPLLRSKLGESYRETSAAFIWATIARMYAARNTGTKAESFGYVSGGYARIIERFGELLAQEKVTCRLGQQVEAITGTNDGQVEVQSGQGSLGAFDEVVVTAAAPLAARMCAQLNAPEKNQLGRIRYQGIICASLLLKESLSGSYITNIADAELPFTAVIEMSAIVDKSQFGGRALVYLPKYVDSNSPDFDLSDDEVREKFLAGLEKMHPQFRREDFLCFQVSRVRYLLPIPTLNYSEHLPAISTSVRGLHILNSAHIVNGTLNINETLQLAESAAKRFAHHAVAAAGTPSQVTHEFAEAHS